MYLAIFCLFRLVLKRQIGGVGITDLLVLVLIADAAQNAMAADYRSLPEGLLLCATLVFWNYTLDWLGFRFPKLEEFLHPHPLVLIKNGRMNYYHMQKELMTEEDLMSRLREKGVEEIQQVKLAYLEGNGKISVIKKE